MSDDAPTPAPWWRRILINLREDATLLLEKFAVIVGVLLVVGMLIGYAIGTCALVGFVLVAIGAYVGIHAVELLVVAAAAFAIATLIRELTRTIEAP